ncbi:alpha/beta-hydrolase [Biscogniauxia mediterranea]|nr:alpha/beta-hydrolase [Biscogniauxia mediterranea]
MATIFRDEFMNFEWLRVLGMAPMQGADVAECFEVAAKIKRSDHEGWFRAWSDAADQAETLGERALHSNDRETARWAFLRASNYRRASQFMLHHLPGDTRLLSIIEKATSTFRKALPLFDSPVKILEIPYDEARLPAYLYLPQQAANGSTGKTPIIVQTSGFDSIQEEMYYFTAAGARTRGYATLTFDGPGQGLVALRDKMYLRPDWEVVISAVLDCLILLADENPEWNLDTSRIAIIGCSMGGYFALRGATDHRIKACISSDGFYDFGAISRTRAPFFWKYLNNSISDFLLGVVAKYHFQTRWEFGHCALTIGTTSISKALSELQRYTVEREGKGSILEDIQCPVLVTGARDTLYDPLGTDRIYDGLTQLQDGQTKVLWTPKGIGQGSLQAKIAALSHLHAEVFHWLDSVFKVQKP